VYKRQGETTLEDIDLSLIGKLEVIKGPASSIYGAGLGGAISLFTQHPGVESAVDASLQIGSFGLLRQVYRLRHSEVNSAWLVNINNTQSDGYRENNEYDRSSATILGKMYGEKGKTTVLGSFIRLRAFIPSSLDSAAWVSNPRQAAFTWGQVMGFEDYDKALLGVSHVQEISSKLDLQASFFGSFRSSYELRPFNILREDNQALGVRSYLHVRQKKWDVTVGGEYFWENYDWQTYQQLNRQTGALLSDQEKLRHYYNLFAQSDIKLSNQLQLTLGLNVNQTSYQLSDYFLADSIDQSGNYQFTPQLSPRLALLYRLSPIHSYYAQLSHGFSPPSVEETLLPEGAINPEIQPETGWNMEIGARGFFENGFSYDISIFHMPIRNLLVARRTDFDQFIGINAGASAHSGLEASLKYDIFSQESAHALSFFANTQLGRYRFTDFVDDDQNYTGNALTGVPSTMLNAGIDWRHQLGLFAHVNWQYVSQMPLRDDNSLFSDAFQRVDAKAGWEKQVAQRWQISFFGGINNVLDSRFASMILPNAGSFGGRPPRYFYPGLPRNYFVGVKVEWNIGGN